MRFRCRNAPVYKLLFTESIAGFVESGFLNSQTIDEELPEAHEDQQPPRMIAKGYFAGPSRSKRDSGISTAISPPLSVSASASLRVSTTVARQVEEGKHRENEKIEPCKSKGLSAGEIHISRVKHSDPAKEQRPSRSASSSWAKIRRRCEATSRVPAPLRQPGAGFRSPDLGTRPFQSRGEPCTCVSNECNCFRSTTPKSPISGFWGNALPGPSHFPEGSAWLISKVEQASYSPVVPAVAPKIRQARQEVLAH